MKKFIIKSSFFLFPFIALYTLNVLFYNQKEGDLVRLGYLYFNPSPKSQINKQYNLNKHYTLLSETDLKSKKKTKVITIGDSFSELERLGYQNFLGNKGVSVLHINRHILDSNPIQALIQLINSDFFDYKNTEYVVLQSVERSFNDRNNDLDFDMSINLDTLSNKIKEHNTKEKKKRNNVLFFSDATFKIPFTNIQYLKEAKPTNSNTYKYKSISNSLFSNTPNDLLFFEDDIHRMSLKNDSLSILQSIKVIEDISAKLAMKNIKLIMLVSPDKYDLFFPFIKDNKSLSKPVFFEIYESEKKNYINVDSYKILSERINSEKDIYYYDDTHWSPKAAQIIAEEIYDIITNKK